MTKSGHQRITPDAIVDAALRISRIDEGRDPTRVTGASLGAALSADRSAVWRHFADKDALLIACGDRLLESVASSAEQVNDPWTRLVEIFNGILGAFRLHPLLAVDITSLPLSGPNWRRLVEAAITALGDIGLAPTAAARYFRVYIEITTSYAATVANAESRPEALREPEYRALAAELFTLDPGEYPHLAATGPLLAAIAQDHVTELMIGAFRLLLDSGREPGSWLFTSIEQLSSTPWEIA
jgi:AcrR family transcriptional regulator